MRWLSAIKSGKYDVIILNFANCDMVGHTGVFDAAVKARGGCRYLRRQGRSRPSSEMDGVLLITADHGNADKMVDAGRLTRLPHTPPTRFRSALSVIRASCVKAAFWRTSHPPC